MFVNKTIDEMLEEIEQPQLRIYCYQVPASVAEALQHPKGDWKFWTNFPITAMAEFYAELNLYNVQAIQLGVEEAIGNAVMHGNKALERRNAPNGDPMKSYSLKLFTGEKGVIVRIRNEGEGFDYEEVIRKYKNGEEYATHGIRGGNGMRILDEKRVQTSYEEKGRVTNIMYVIRKL